MFSTPANKAWLRLVAGVFVTTCHVLAQAAPATPSGGTLLQEIKPDAGTRSPNGPALIIQPQSPDSLTESTAFTIRRIDIEGNTLLNTASLHALVKNAEGQTLTLNQLKELASRITEDYHQHGYPLARAYIPAQTINDGIVRIKVIEAHYDGIELNNHSRVSNRLLKATLSPLRSGSVIDQSRLDRSLLLLSDIPGLEVNATLSPGGEVGSANLVINAEAGPPITGYVYSDDYGNRYTGRARIGGTVNFNNPLHQGDVFSASGLSSGHGLNYGRISYEALLNGCGTRMGLGYSTLDYYLSGKLASLNAHGTAQTTSLWLRHPLLRSREANVYGQVQYDHRQLNDDIGSSSIRTHRHTDDSTASLYGDLRDRVLSGGLNNFNLSYTTGRVAFDDAIAQLADAATVRTRGVFSRWNGSLSRLQRVTDQNAVYLTVNGQWADRNLDPAEKMIIGGPYSVRAYDVGVLSGDTGYFASAEWRYSLPIHVGGQWEAIGFYDTGHIVINHHAVGAGPHSATLSGAGVGLNWTGQNQWSARAHIASSIGSTSPLVGQRNSVRSWVEISKGFW